MNINTINTARCGFCAFNDGYVYTSKPPQVKCTIDNDFRKIDDRCKFNDLVQVVRCKDCDRSRKTELGWVCTNTGASVASDGNGYCSNGRRRTNEGNVLR